MVHVSIDMSLPANQQLKPELGENTFTEVFYVPLAKLEAEGYASDARVGTLEGSKVDPTGGLTEKKANSVASCGPP